MYARNNWIFFKRVKSKLSNIYTLKLLQGNKDNVKQKKKKQLRWEKTKTYIEKFIPELLKRQRPRSQKHKCYFWSFWWYNRCIQNFSNNNMRSNLFIGKFSCRSRRKPVRYDLTTSRRKNVTGTITLRWIHVCTDKEDNDEGNQDNNPQRLLHMSAMARPRKNLHITGTPRLSCFHLQQNVLQLYF